MTAPQVSRPRTNWRPEIQGLRALALLLVVAYHFWFGRVSGGVDVFLLVSAFLLTSSWASRLTEGRILGKGSFLGLRSLLTYWVRVFKRLLPLASLTVLLTLLGTYIFVPEERWLSILDEAKAVVFYQHNWWSIEQAVDYYAADSSQASPLRHFWSLSVQGQVYLLWPLVFWALALVLGRFRSWGRGALILVFGLIFAVSLAYSIEATASNQATAYFDTWARLWEFALGSLVALVLPWVRLPAGLRAVLGWLGIVAILTCGFVLDVNGSFPGYVALWPTLAAALIILAGDTGTRFGPEKLLTAKPLLALGSYSYALYLVHWPLLIFYLSQTKQEKAGLGAGMVLLLLSLVLAWALTSLVEKPLSSWSLPNRSILAGAAVAVLSVGLVLAPAHSWKKNIYDRVALAETQRELNNVGAAVLDVNYHYQGSEDAITIPVRAVLDTDWADLGPSCSSLTPDLALPENLECHYLVHNPEAEKTIIAVGNSHMQMWMTALRPLAQEQNWQVLALTRGGCFLGAEDNEAYASGEDCQEWAAATEDFIQAYQPDTVLLMGSKALADEPDQLLTNAQQRVEAYTQAGISVIGIRDTPRMAQMHKDCMDSVTQGGDCVKNPGQDVYADPQLAWQEAYPGFAALNLSDLVCPDNGCPASIGNIYTYFDYDHITATYVATLGPYFNPRFLASLESAEAGLAQAGLAPDAGGEIWLDSDFYLGQEELEEVASASGE